jgi:hypothetical protein
MVVLWIPVCPENLKFKESDFGFCDARAPRIDSMRGAVYWTAALTQLAYRFVILHSWAGQARKQDTKIGDCQLEGTFLIGRTGKQAVHSWYLY